MAGEGRSLLLHLRVERGLDGRGREVGRLGLDEEAVDVLRDEVRGLLAQDGVEIRLPDAVADVVPGRDAEAADLRVALRVVGVAAQPEVAVLDRPLGRRADVVQWAARRESPEVQYLVVDGGQVQLERRLIEADAVHVDTEEGLGLLLRRAEVDLAAAEEGADDDPQVLAAIFAVRDGDAGERLGERAAPPLLGHVRTGQDAVDLLVDQFGLPLRGRHVVPLVRSAGPALRIGHVAWARGPQAQLVEGVVQDDDGHGGRLAGPVPRAHHRRQVAGRPAVLAALGAGGPPGELPRMAPDAQPALSEEADIAGATGEVIPNGALWRVDGPQADAVLGVSAVAALLIGERDLGGVEPGQSHVPVAPNDEGGGHAISPHRAVQVEQDQSPGNRPRWR